MKRPGKRSGAPARKRGRRRKAGGKSGAAELTSHPTSRNAQMETRAWLLSRHGPVCAYCGTKHSPRVMTLDHVAPRRGQTAYDRRDNLVLACRDCNAKKRDLPPLAFLLALRTRAANLLRYGGHLSAGLVELARSLAPDQPPTPSGKRVTYGPDTDDDESPYRD
jgi:5-methylcytosine-specific restriction endonuclease McrA